MLRFLGSNRRRMEIRRASRASRIVKRSVSRVSLRHTPRTRKHLAVQAVLALLLTLAVGSLVYSVPSFTGMATFTSSVCHDNQICDSVSSCTSTGSCTTTYQNCQSCGVTTRVCGSDVIAAPNKCRDTGTPTCINAVPICNSPASPDPYKVLTFNVYTRKTLLVNVTPLTQTGIAGTTLTYTITAKNNNPRTLSFIMSAEAPPGWSVNIAAQVSIVQNSQRDIIFRVTSNETSSDNTYPVVIGLFNSELSLYGTATVTYVVGSRAPPGVTTDPRINRGYPGKKVYYNVTAVNGDPEGFDASTFSFNAVMPGGFTSEFTPNSLRIAAQQSGSSMLAVTSATNATDPSYPIMVNVTGNRLSGIDFVEYQIDLCGNNVCDFGEENSCGVDCPVDPYIICAGRCETQLDDGVQFSAAVTIPFDKFIVCSRNSTTAACAAAARARSGCGNGSACLCSSSTDSQCNIRCVDTRATYYIMVNGTTSSRTLANYSYACPFVNLPDFRQMRDSFVTAKQDYEMAKSALTETLAARNITLAEKTQGQPCIDALGGIIGKLGPFVAYLNRVIAWPGLMNTTEARGAADDMRDYIDITYNSYCQGATGLLQIQEIGASTVEKGNDADLTVSAANFGSITYYGYPSCDLTGGNGEKITVNGTCSAISGGSPITYDIPVATTSAGMWRARCRMIGSLVDNCSVATIHDDRTGNFSVFSKEAYVADVSGTCGGQNDAAGVSRPVNCTVKTTRGCCGQCSL